MVVTDLDLNAAMENISHMLHMLSGCLQFIAIYCTSLYVGGFLVCIYSQFFLLDTVVHFEVMLGFVPELSNGFHLCFLQQKVFLKGISSISVQ